MNNNNENKKKVGKVKEKQKKLYGAGMLFFAAFITAVATTFGTLLVQKGFIGVAELIKLPKTTEPLPYRVTLSAPTTDDKTGDRLQVLLIENLGSSAVQDFECKISCNRAVDASTPKLVSSNSSSSLRRTDDAIFIDSKCFSSGGFVMVLLWQKVGGIQPNDVTMSWEGKTIEPSINYLR